MPPTERRFKLVLDGGFTRQKHRLKQFGVGQVALYTPSAAVDDFAVSLGAVVVRTHHPDHDVGHAFAFLHKQQQGIGK